MEYLWLRRDPSSLCLRILVKVDGTSLPAVPCNSSGIQKLSFASCEPVISVRGTWTLRFDTDMHKSVSRVAALLYAFVSAPGDCTVPFP